MTVKKSRSPVVVKNSGPSIEEQLLHVTAINVATLIITNPVFGFNMNLSNIEEMAVVLKRSAKTGMSIVEIINEMRARAIQEAAAQQQQIVFA